MVEKLVLLTLLGDRHHQNARSQAPAWERTVFEAPPPAFLVRSSRRQAEPAIHWVPRQSLGTSWWRSARSAVLSIVFALSVIAARPSFATEPTIDSILASAHETHQLTPAEICSDRLFLRRVTLDLAGRIPTLEEIRDFDRSPNRSAKIDHLLQSPEFSSSWAEVWTSVFVGYQSDLGGDRELFQDWLYKSLQANDSYSRIAKRMIAAKGQSALDGPVNFLLRAGDEPMIRVSRLFLGVRLDCARCHDHPFDRWTMNDFTRMSQFYSAMRTRQLADGNIEFFDDTRSTKQVALEERPKFLTGAQPRTALWRDELALFIAQSKPFARVFANRIWYQLMGRGIVDPPDDFNNENVASSKELLEFLADQSRAGDFNIRTIVRLICNSEAYQRESVKQTASSSDASIVDPSVSQLEKALFAVRSIKPLTPEQSIDSMKHALNQKMNAQQRTEFIHNAIGANLGDDFSATWQYKETVQALMSRLTFGIQAPQGSLDELFLRSLTRLPSDAERLACDGVTPDTIAFALVNSSEFFFQH